jgi:hypothetical protein
MEVPPMTPPPTGAGRDALSADAYELFWDCLENDAAGGDNAPPADDPPADAYGQFWQQVDA